MVNCQAKSKLRVAGTLAAVPFRIIDWDFRARAPARNRARTNRSITSTSTISLSTRTTEPTHRGIGGRTILRSRDYVFALVAEEQGTHGTLRTHGNKTHWNLCSLSVFSGAPVSLAVLVS